MARGGARSNAGRKRGAATRKTREIADRAAEAGVSPLEYLLTRMRDESETPAMRLDAAKSAAPYVHPRLANIEHKGSLAIRKAADLTDDELAVIANARG